MPFFQDFSYCVVAQPNLIGDGRCHNVGKYNTAGCSFDGGDCEEFNALYPNCKAEYPFQMGDGICQIENNNIECKFDGGDCLEFSQRFPDCMVDDISLLGDRVCNGGMYNTAECGFDDRDCIGFNQRFPGCNVDIPLKIGNGVCNKGPYNTAECKFDNGDCDGFNQKHPECIDDTDIGYKGLKCTADLEGFDDTSALALASQKPTCVLNVNCNKWLSEKYPDCKAVGQSLIGDGICQGATFSGNTPECGYEGGDCVEFNTYFPNCTIYGAYMISDGYCDGKFNTAECGFDGGDCIEFNVKYFDCDVDFPGKIGNDHCDGGSYNTPECGNDGGDCDALNKYPNCTVRNPDWIGDGQCNGGSYNTPECGFDDGDCNAVNSHYPKCVVTVHFKIDNGVCDGGRYNTAECGFDGGDCKEFNKMYPNCKVKYPKYIGDDKCNRGSYNIPECGFDGGDCYAFNTMYPNCIVDDPSFVGNGICNGGSYNTPECGFDGGDCLICSSDNENCLSDDAVLFIDGEKKDTETSKRESLTNAIFQTVASIVSLLASITILWMVFRSHEQLSSIFHRLLLMLSISDIISSIAIGLSTIPIPSEYKDIIWNAKGNTTTCQMQGFFIFIGSMAAPLYNCSLCWYYVFVVKFQKKDDYIKKTVEPFLHGIPIIFSLIGAVTILVNGAFNANMSFCFIGTDPTCDDFDCISSFDAKMLFIIFSAAPYIILPIVILVTMGIMFQAVLAQEKTRKRYGSIVLRGNIKSRIALMSESSEDTSKKGNMKILLSKMNSVTSTSSVRSSRETTRNNPKMSRLILNRALAYSFGFIFTYTLPMIISINTLLNRETGFFLSILARILFPLQGFFNFLIFIYPRVLHAKRSSSNISWYKAFVQGLYSKGRKRKFQYNSGVRCRCCAVNCWKKRSRRESTGEEEKVEIEGATTIASVGNVKSNHSSYQIDIANVSMS